MRPLALLLAGALAAAPATAGRIEFTAEEHAECEAQGGCQVVTMQFLKSLYRDGFEDGKATCKAKV